jgi:hypothetical protein
LEKLLFHYYPLLLMWSLKNKRSVVGRWCEWNKTYELLRVNVRCLLRLIIKFTYYSMTFSFIWFGTNKWSWNSYLFSWEQWDNWIKCFWNFLVVGSVK